MAKKKPKCQDCKEDGEGGGVLLIRFLTQLSESCLIELVKPLLEGRGRQPLVLLKLLQCLNFLQPLPFHQPHPQL